MTRKVRLNLYLTESYAEMIRSWCSSHPHSTYGDFVERCIFKALSKPDSATGIPRIPKKNPTVEEKAPRPNTAMPRPNSATTMPRPLKKENHREEEEYRPAQGDWNSLRKHGSSS